MIAPDTSMLHSASDCYGTLYISVFILPYVRQKSFFQLTPIGRRIKAIFNDWSDEDKTRIINSDSVKLVNTPEAKLNRVNIPHFPKWNTAYVDNQSISNKVWSEYSKRAIL